jgi:serine/threonine protein phosphatase PrpC
MIVAPTTNGSLSGSLSGRARSAWRRAWQRRDGVHGATPSASLDAWGRTDRGRVRPINEDRCLVAALDRPTGATADSTGLLLIVADGVGGRPGGELASALAVDAMACYVQTMVPWVLTAAESDRERLDAWLCEALRRTQTRMRRLAARRGVDPRMATTLTMACVTGSDLVVAHVGDSRCYLARDGALERLTVDHTLAQRLFEDGQLDADELERSPFGHMLLNAVGGSTDELGVDLQRVRLRAGDQLLLCTDGLTRYVRDDELGQRLADRAPLDTTVDGLIASARDRGGADNITVVLARLS